MILKYDKCVTHYIIVHIFSPFIVENHFRYHNLSKMEDSENESLIAKERIEGKSMRAG